MSDDDQSLTLDDEPYTVIFDSDWVVASTPGRRWHRWALALARFRAWLRRRPR